MWWLRRITMVAVPCAAARSVARSMARATSHGPGSRRPSHSTLAPRSLTTSHSPCVAMPPVAIAFK